MKAGGIEIVPLAAESMGVRSLCTYLRTPDVSILLDPSAALAFRPPYDPHPYEYLALESSLSRIRQVAMDVEIITVSHYHFDHVRPGITDWRYNFSTREERLSLYSGKKILAKDGRENVNASQRRRAFYFEKDLRGKVEIEWADGKRFTFGDTTITFSLPLPHGPEDSKLGYVLSTLIEFGDSRFLFAPDVQGPISRKTLAYFLKLDPHVVILGGPPIYLKQFSEHESQEALYALTTLVTAVDYLVVDHHLLRTTDWEQWIKPIQLAAERAGHTIGTMADLAGQDRTLLEASREELYRTNPPSQEFERWLSSSDEYKTGTRPPI
ncbi:MAG: MBL fold metallo-hydrolase [Candidatus Thorarchaeota archaeon]